MGGVEGCFSEHLAEEGLVSLHVGMVGASKKAKLLSSTNF